MSKHAESNEGKIRVTCRVILHACLKSSMSSALTCFGAPFTSEIQASIAYFSQYELTPVSKHVHCLKTYDNSKTGCLQN